MRAPVVFLLGLINIGFLPQYSSGVDNESKSEASNRFSLDLFKNVQRLSKGNVVISPLSVSTLIALLEQGASGNTSLQLQKAIHLNPEEARNQYSFINHNLKKRKTKVSLEFGNAVFLNKDLHIKEHFKDAAKSSFLADVIPVNFLAKTDAVNQINYWASQATKNKINDLISERSISEQTEMVLTNAIYFKGVWQKTFNISETQVGEFYPTADSKTNAKLMHQISYFRAGEDNNLGAKWVELPFDGDEFSMVCVLPKERNALDQVISRMTFNDLGNMLNTRTSKKVDLVLPRFKLESSSSLIRALQMLGIFDIFTSSANLKGISPQKGLYLSDIIQKANIEVNEEGSQASAATVAVVNMLSLKPVDEDLIFMADHPFLVIIVDKISSVPLFMAKIVNPMSR